MPRLFDFDDIVEFAELVGFDVLVVGVGDPFAVNDEAVAVAAWGEGEAHSPFALAGIGFHGGGIGGPVVEIAGDGDGFGVLEAGAEDEVGADLLDALNLGDFLFGGFLGR